MRIAIIMLVLALLLVGCVNEQVPETTQPTVAPTEQNQPEETTQPTTLADPFEGEADIDFSDFDTEPETTRPTEPERTEQSAAEPTTTMAPTTEPEMTETETTQPEPEETTQEPTEPTEPETSAAPSYGTDGYNNHIVRP